MSERMPVEDVIGPAATADPWTCPRCGRENKATWAQCPACEANRAGVLPGEGEPRKRTSKRTNPVNAFIGLAVIVGLVVLVVMFYEDAGTWIGEQWEAFRTWMDGASLDDATL